MKAKECESCGMIMVEKEDFGGENFNNKYCVYCTDKLGNLKPYYVRHAELAELIRRRMRCTKEVAEKLARNKLIQYPAWKHRGY